MPPTSNNLFATVSGKGFTFTRKGKIRNKSIRVKTKDYVDWLAKAVPVMREMGQVKNFPVEVRIVLFPGDGWRSTSDVANREKAVTDALVTAGVIPDDNTKYVYGVRVALGGRLKGPGCVVVMVVPFRAWWLVLNEEKSEESREGSGG